jgi:hypothetical protein
VNLGIVLRWTDPNNWYKAFIDGQHLTILRDIKGTMSVLAQANVVTSAGVAQTLLFRSFGTLLCAKVWPSDTPEPQNWMLSTRDKTFSTGQFGIRVFEQPHTEITILSFKATAVSP